MSRSLQSIRWTEHLIYLGVNRDLIRPSPKYDAARAVTLDFDRDMDRRYGPSLPADAS